MMGKKGQMGGYLMLGSFIFMLLVIGGGIAAGTLLFFGTGYDFRKADSHALNYKISKLNLAKDGRTLRNPSTTAYNKYFKSITTLLT